MRALALSVGATLMTGCGVLFGLDGLEGRPCSICDDASAPGQSGDTGPGPDSAIHVDSATSTATDTGSEAASPVEDANRDEGNSDVASSFDANPDAAVCSPPAPPGLDDCKAIASMPAPPVIDGIVDCGVALWPMPVEGWNGSSPIPAGVQAVIGAAFRANGLYLFVSVTGLGPHRYPAPAGDGQWCGDAVELFVDSNGVYDHPPAYDVPGTMQFIVVAPSDAMASSTAGEEFQNANDQGAWSGQFVSVRTADGFDAEAFIVAGDLGLTSWSLAAAGHVGLDVAVDIGNPAQTPASCPALGQFLMQQIATDASCTAPACNVDEFCRPLLQ